VGSEGDFEGVMMSRSREILPSEKLVGRSTVAVLQPNHRSTCKDLITDMSLAKEPRFEIAARPYCAPPEEITSFISGNTDFILVCLSCTLI
jgi:hypothetical protein